MTKWLSKPAVLWALDEAPNVPARLVAALLAVARYAGEDGRGARPSAATIAVHIRKTERNAKKDLAELQRLGLLLPGDPRTVIHIRADRRPNVYDLPMPRGASGRTSQRSPRGVAHDTPLNGHGVSQATTRGVAEGHHGVSPATPEEFLKNSGNGAAPASGAAEPPAPCEHGEPRGPAGCYLCRTAGAAP